MLRCKQAWVVSDQVGVAGRSANGGLGQVEGGVKVNQERLAGKGQLQLREESSRS